MLNFPSALEVALQYQVDRLTDENKYLRGQAKLPSSVLFDPEGVTMAYPLPSHLNLPSVAQIRAEPASKMGGFHVMAKAQTNTGCFALDYYTTERELFDTPWAGRALSVLHENFTRQLGEFVLKQK